jgi:uncharacterized membrane protein YeaQ/YmgE (transglycosylase-associated protein family)
MPENSGKMGCMAIALIVGALLGFFLGPSLVPPLEGFFGRLIGAMTGAFVMLMLIPVLLGKK